VKLWSTEKLAMKRQIGSDNKTSHDATVQGALEVASKPIPLEEQNYE
jgi:hypothetical protein